VRQVTKSGQSVLPATAAAAMLALCSCYFLPMETVLRGWAAEGFHSMMPRRRDISSFVSRPSFLQLPRWPRPRLG
jgi:hypothetical protein